MERPAWQWHAMGTTWRVFHSGQVRQEDADAVVLQVALDEQRWSRLLAESELSRLNNGDGMPVRVSAETIELLAACDRWWERTGGVFSLLVGAAVTDWGHAESRDTQPLGIGASLCSVAIPQDRLVFDADYRLARVPPGSRLDLGGIATMWSAQRAARVLAARCDDPCLLVEAGGDMVAARGDHIVSVEAPGDHMIVVHESQGIATSGWSRRRWGNGDGRAAHQLIDPPTGAPGPRVQATVRSDDPIEAEIEAKLLALRPYELKATSNPALVWDHDDVYANQAWVDADVTSG